MNGFTLTATHITTATVDTLTDHCHGDRELLISGYMSADTDLTVARGEAIDALLYDTNGNSVERLPFVASELESAITAVVNNIHESDLITSDEEEDRLIWIRLHW
jgi:hypothetical protein